MGAFKEGFCFYVHYRNFRCGCFFLRWSRTFSTSHNIFTSIFHAVSAFCNAGFSLFRNSLEGYYKDPVTLITFALLIFLGGIGFFTINDLLMRISGRSKKLSLNTKIVLITSGVLITFGTVLIFFFELSHTMKGESWYVSLLNSFFQSVTARTAGFNSIPISGVSLASAFTLMMLMFVGASSGSCGGGVKTGTLAVFLLSVKSAVRGTERVEFFGKTIPYEVILRAITVIAGGAFLVSSATLLILFFENGRFPLDRVMFEVISAFGTVGLSRGITRELSAPSLTVLMIIMYLGRVGILNIAWAVRRRKISRFEYPEENVMVG